MINKGQKCITYTTCLTRFRIHHVLYILHGNLFRTEIGPVKLATQIFVLIVVIVGKGDVGGHILYQKTPTKCTEFCATAVKFRVKSLCQWVWSFRQPYDPTSERGTVGLLLVLFDVSFQYSRKKEVNRKQAFQNYGKDRSLSLRAECLLKTNCGYPKDAGVVGEQQVEGHESHLPRTLSRSSLGQPTGLCPRPSKEA